MSILAKPPSRLRVAGARLRNEAPEVARVIEPPQMHQLVNQNVFADGLGHQDETPVETDVTGRRARSPARPLIPYADTRHLKAVTVGQAKQLGGQIARGLPAQLLHILWSIREAQRRVFLYPRFLTLNPGALLLGK
jgi:hypothetical protein